MASQMWASMQYSADALRQILTSAVRCLAPLLPRPRRLGREELAGCQPWVSPSEAVASAVDSVLVKRPNVGTCPSPPGATVATAVTRASTRLAGACHVLPSISEKRAAAEDGKDGGHGNELLLRDLDLSVLRGTYRQTAAAIAASHVVPVYKPPRYPIVLCHGLFGYNTLGPQSIPWLQRHYWSGIEEALRTLGATVLTTSVPPTGDVVQRAEALDAQLRLHMAGRDVNLVAHSMGGLDCRYLTFVKSRRERSEGSKEMEGNYRIRSLTTLATPHRGSPFMDWCRDNMGLGWAKALKRHFLALASEQEKAENELPGIPQAGANDGADCEAKKGKESPKAALHASTLVSRLMSALDYPAYACLTTDFCKNVFNRAVPDVPGVSYYSYGAAVELPVYDKLWFPWDIVRRKEGPNDGIVSMQSARWGRYWETLETDHFELTKRRLSRALRDPTTGRVTLQPKKRKPPEGATTPTAFDTIEFVCRMATRLHHEGF